jgi:DNA repair protein RadC
MEKKTKRRKKSNGIDSWAEDARPRERLLRQGAGSLSNMELLAILLRNGTESRSALDVARDVMKRAHNNLQELGRLSTDQLQQVRGIGKVKAVTIAAALELGRRRQLTVALARDFIQTSRDAADVVIPLLSDLDHEEFCVLFLNQANRVLYHECVSSGGLTGTIVDIRVILKKALLYNANGLILAHNHPSGSLNPSQADRDLTKRVKTAAGYMDIRLLDHLIVGDNEYLSMRDEGMI